MLGRLLCLLETPFLEKYDYSLSGTPGSKECDSGWEKIPWVYGGWNEWLIIIRYDLHCALEKEHNKMPEQASVKRIGEDGKLFVNV